ncbi:MAG TPA: DNA-3-methyladenine glycosylase 2 family protein, partial [Patescibacteria group bacterium]|nr:DNA-3-methyladenine glycosylase 2 family protein [Patescibacteria group bacterium]
MKAMSMRQARRYLKKADPVMAGLVLRLRLQERRGRRNYFQALAVAIINQQLSTKAADAIEGRFRALFAPARFPAPAQVLRKSDCRLRGAGLSYQKIGYLKSLAKLVQAGRIEFKKFAGMDDEAVIAQLTQIKGVGRWTAEMFLMFCLNRPDVFAHGDLGLQ